MKSLESFLNKFIAPVAKWMNNNIFFSSLAEAFMRITPITLGGAIVLLIGNFPIKAWTDFLSKIGFSLSFTAAQNATMNCLALFVVFNFAYVYAKKSNFDPLPAGLLSVAAFFTLMPQDYMARLAGTHVKLAQNVAFSTNYVGASGIIVAIVVGWIVAALYVWLNRKNLVIKLPASVPPNVSESLRPSIISGVILVAFVIIRIMFEMLPGLNHFGNIFALFTKLVQTPLQHFVASPISLIAVYTLANVLWFFGIHPNMVYGVIMPLITAEQIINQNAFKAGHTMPYLTVAILTVALGNAFGGQGTTIGLVISMIKSKSKRYKQMFKLAVVPSLFNINEPLVFGMPIMMNPVFFLPMVLTPICCGTASLILMHVLNLAKVFNPMIMLPWTMPGVIQTFLSGGIQFLTIAIVVVIISTIIWYPFFKIADKKAYQEEQAE